MEWHLLGTAIDTTIWHGGTIKVHYVSRRTLYRRKHVEWLNDKVAKWNGTQWLPVANMKWRWRSKY